MKKHFALICAILFIGMIFYSPVVKAQEDVFTYFEANFPAQELVNSDLTIENNIANQSSVRTELDVWEQDLGVDVTDGSYSGAIFESSLFEIDYDPLRANETYDYTQTTIGWNVNVGRPRLRTVFTIASEVRFENRVIMSGATEFYMKIPIHPDCIDQNEMMPSIYFFDIGQTSFDRTRLNLRGSHCVSQTFYTNETYFDENGDRQQTQTSIGQILPYNDTWSLRLFYGNQESNIKTDANIIKSSNIYARIFGTIEPNTNYVVAMTCIIKRDPLIYLTEEDIHNNGRSGTYQCSDIEYSYTEELWVDRIEIPNQIDLQKRFLKTWSDYVPTPSGTPPNPPYAPAGINVVSSFVNKTDDFPVDLAWSFVFKAGRGQHGMFGKRFHFEKDDSLVFYERLNQPTSDSYISVMLPFISEKQIRVNLSVILLDQNSNDENMFESEFVYDADSNQTGWIHKHWWNAEEIMSYRDYILFTIPRKIRADTITSRATAKIIVTFVDDCDVTFMFSTLSSSSLNSYSVDYYHNDFDKSSEIYGTPVLPTPQWVDVSVRDKICYIYRDTKQINMAMLMYENSFADDYPIADVNNTRQFLNYYPDITLHYELFKSVQFTDGIWAEIVTTPEGYQYATHFFERRLAVGVIDLWVDTTNNETNYQQKWYENEYWGIASDLLQKGDVLGAIYYGLKGVVTSLWNGLQVFLGTVIGIFTKLVDTLVGIGKFVYSIITGFIDQVFSIIGDIADGVEQVLDVLIYVVTIFIFMLVAGWIGRLLYYNRKVSSSGL